MHAAQHEYTPNAPQSPDDSFAENSKNGDASSPDDDVAEWFKKTKPAPLCPFARFVLEQFLERNCHDKSTLQAALQGCPTILPRDDTDREWKRATTFQKAYRLVAAEVLSQLRSAGYLRRDDVGWHHPTLRGSEGLPPRRRAELLLEHLTHMGISVYLKDGEPRINFKNAKPKISRDEILGVVLLFRGEILEVLTETSRPASAKEVAR